MWRAEPHTIKSTMTHARLVTSTRRSCGGGAYRGKASGVTNSPRAKVISVAVVVAGFEPSSVTDDGVTPQVAPAGATEQVQVTVWSNPCAGAADTMKFACCPALIVPLAGKAETL
jgi:hypothetical protein